MAILNTPTKKAFRRASPQKWHLPGTEGNYDGLVMTACGLILYDGEREEIEVEAIPARSICQKCLGPLIATDEE